MARLIGAEGRRAPNRIVQRDETGRWVDSRRVPPPEDGPPERSPPDPALGHIHPRHIRASILYGLLMLLPIGVMAYVFLTDAELGRVLMADDAPGLVFVTIFGGVSLATGAFAFEALFGLAGIAYDHRGFTYRRWGRARTWPWTSLSQAGVVVRRTGRNGRSVTIVFREVPGGASPFTPPPLDHASATIRIPMGLFMTSKSAADDLAADINAVRAEVLGERLVRDIAAG